MKTDTVQIRRILTDKCAALGIPVSGIFELTPRCNLSCKMCYIRMTPEEMKLSGKELTKDEWLSLAASAVKEGMVFLLITGGEPLLRNDFCEIYEGLMKLGLSICINTNGTLIDDSIKALWKRLPPAYVNISLYGLSGEDYEEFCGNKDAFYKVTDALNWLKNEGILVHLNATLTPENRHKAEDLYRFSQEYGAQLRVTTYCFPPVRQNSSCKAHNCFTRLSPEQAAEATVNDIYLREGTEGIIKRAADMEKPSASVCELESGEPMSCTAGRAQFWTAWNGSITPCGMLSSPAMSCRDNAFSDIWKKIKDETLKITLSEKCSVCPERSTCTNCAATAFAETGHFDGKPEYLCAMNKEYRRILSEYNKP